MKKTFTMNELDEWRKTYSQIATLKNKSNQILFIDKYVNLNEPKNILDIGSAFGDTLALLRATKQNHCLCGIEKNKQMAEQSRKEQPYLTILNQDCCIKNKFKSNYFDLIICFDTLEHIPEYKGIMYQEINRMLKNDGVVIFITPNCNWIMKILYTLTGNNYIINKSVHPNIYTKQKLTNEIKQFLNIYNIKNGFDLNWFTKLLSLFEIFKHVCVIATKK